MDKKRIYGVWTMLLMILTAGSVVAVWRSACAGEAAFRRESCVPPGRGRETGIPGRDGNQPGV